MRRAERERRGRLLAELEASLRASRRAFLQSVEAMSGADHGPLLDALEASAAFRGRDDLERLDEGVREAIDRDLRCPLFADASDHELAFDHGVRPHVVRLLRAELRRELGLAEILRLARLLARETGFQGEPGPLVVRVLQSALRAVRARKALQVNGPGHSVDRAASRSRGASARADAESARGAARGAKGPRVGRRREAPAEAAAEGRGNARRAKDARQGVTWPSTGGLTH